MRTIYVVAHDAAAAKDCQEKAHFYLTEFEAHAVYNAIDLSLTGNTFKAIIAYIGCDDYRDDLSEAVEDAYQIELIDYTGTLPGEISEATA